MDGSKGEFDSFFQLGSSRGDRAFRDVPNHPRDYTWNDLKDEVLTEVVNLGRYAPIFHRDPTTNVTYIAPAHAPPPPSPAQSAPTRVEERPAIDYNVIQEEGWY